MSTTKTLKPENPSELIPYDGWMWQLFTDADHIKGVGALVSDTDTAIESCALEPAYDGLALNKSPAFRSPESIAEPQIWRVCYEKVRPLRAIKFIRVLAIVKAGTAETPMRVNQITVREDGTLWAAKNTWPLLNSSGPLSNDQLMPLVSSKQWGKIPADNYMRLGINLGDKECIDAAKLDSRLVDTSTAADKARYKVDAAYAKAERLQDNGGVSSAIVARMEAEELAAEWAATYPEAAFARKAAAGYEEASRQARIRNSDGYKAAMEGRD